MRLLTVVRHAKADDPLHYENDIDRPLTEKGFKDSRTVARLLGQLDPAVDWWISSPALRARETVTTLAAELGFSGEVRYEELAYPGNADNWLAIVAAAPLNAQHVAIVGHNPGLEEFVAGLCAANALHLNFRLPTASVAHLELELARWDQIRWGCGLLRTLIQPRLLKK